MKLYVVTILSALLGGVTSAVARKSVGAVLGVDGDVESFVQVDNNQANDGKKSYSFQFANYEQLTISETIYDKRLLVPHFIMTSPSFPVSETVKTSLGRFFPLSKDTPVANKEEYILPQYNSTIPFSSFNLYAYNGTKVQPVNEKGKDFPGLPKTPGTPFKYDKVTNVTLKMDVVYNLNLINREVVIPKDAIFMIDRTSNATIPPRIDYDSPFPSQCSERFYYNYILGATCNDTMLLSDPYPYFPQTDPRNMTNQAQACETLCSGNAECAGYSVQAMLDKDKLPILSTLKCRLCDAKIYNPNNLSFYVASFANGKASTSNYVDGAGFEHDVSSLMGVKFYQDYSSSKTGVVFRPCHEDVVCAVVNNGFAAGETCGGEASYDIKKYEFEFSNQDGTNGMYMMACLQHMYEEHLRNGREDVRCATTSIEWDPSRSGSKLVCKYYSHTTRVGVGPSLFSAAVITEPFCQIPLEKSTLHERTTPFVVDCRDRATAYSRVSEDLLDIDCSLLKLPGMIVESGDITCDSYIWQSPYALEQYSNNANDLKESFLHEQFWMWCPTTCQHLTKCNVNPNLFA